MPLPVNRQHGDIVDPIDINEIAKTVNEIMDGTSATVIRESVASSAELPDSGNMAGDARIAEDTGHFWVWDGTGWDDVGPVAQGPPGEGDTLVESAEHPGLYEIKAEPGTFGPYIILAAGAPIPPGTPEGTLIFRRVA